MHPVPSSLWPILLLHFLSMAAMGQGHAVDVAAERMTVAEGLTIKLFASEPQVRQPNLVKMGPRGRLWTIQYLQYPLPAGLQRVSMDRYWRTVYDRVPEPPPAGPRGADVITILEDTDGDGVADTFKNFVEGLNLTSGLAFGHGGVFVLQVPYLLFYPDRNRDDVPDSDPQVMLRGFGMEDAQSLANHLTWGPDGWLYGVNGSTTTCNIRGVEFQQGCWRYHPPTDRFELFCEGGGNTYGLTFDKQGNLFYTTNGGPFVHAVQGAYFYKWFGKHGPLQNPHAYGYFGHVDRDVDPGVPTGGIIYEGHSFPKKFHSSFLVGSFLGHSGSWWQVAPRATTFEATFGGELFDSHDSWFGPTDMCAGADGSVFVADFHEERQHHPDPDSPWDRSNGRIYKIEAAETTAVVGLDLHRHTSAELVELLTHPNRWYVERARVLLAERRDAKLRTALIRMALQTEHQQLALEGLWALHVTAGLSDDVALRLLCHPYSYVRSWTVRRLGDEQQVSRPIAKKLVELAKSDPSRIVRSQLAATAKRLPSDDALPIVYALLARGEDHADERIPWLLWWAIEAKSISHTNPLLEYFARKSAWDQRTNHLQLRHLIRRWSAAGTPAGYLACDALLATTPSNHLDRMLEALNRGLAMRGTNHAPLNASLRQTIEAYWRQRPGQVLRWELALRASIDDAYDRLLQPLEQSEIDESQLLEALRLLHQFGQAESLSGLIRLIGSDRSAEVQAAAIEAANRFESAELVDHLVDNYGNMPHNLRAEARRALLSRPGSAKLLLAMVEREQIAPEEISIEELRGLKAHDDPRLETIVHRYWGRIGPATPEETLAKIAQFSYDLELGPGDRSRGKQLFAKHCGNCHQLFGEGSEIGPDLTHSNREDTSALLTAIVDPSSVIRPQYLSYVATRNDGRRTTGLMVDQNAASVTLLDAENRRTTIPRDAIEQLAESSISLMPEKLLEPLSPQQRRDLFSYIAGDPLAGVSDDSRPLGANKTLRLRTRTRRVSDTGHVTVLENSVAWEPRRTALINCDMWDTNTCASAVKLSLELAPPMNQVMREARALGVLVIHAPSGVVGFYAGTPQRERAERAPQAENFPPAMDRWCGLQRDRDLDFPIEVDGCNCTPTCDLKGAITRQMEALQIADGDVISDSGREIWNLFEQHGIDNVIIMGVHANLCVLGRPFGIRNLVRAGKHVVLIRDLTDTIYNPDCHPHVNHFTGTDLIVEHIERHWCPTITSTALTGTPPFRFAEDQRPRIVMVIAEDEYEANRTLPTLAREHLGKDFRVAIVSANPENRNDLAGIAALKTADLAILFVRRRLLPADQLAHVRRYIDAGRPVLAIRTTSHGFCDSSGRVPPGKEAWPEFDQEVLGCRYEGGFGKAGAASPATWVHVLPEQKQHPILRGLPMEKFLVRGSLYRHTVQSESAKTLVVGHLADRAKRQPVAWSNIHAGGGRVFYTSLGHPQDLDLPAVQQMLVNAIHWLLDREISP